MSTAVVQSQTVSGFRTHAGVRLGAQIFIGSLLMALAAHISIRLPLSPVAISLQSAMVIALGICLGPRAGALAVATYLIEGMMGLPVFTSGMSGIAWMLSPSGGYLIGFLPAAYLAGRVAQLGSSRLNLLLAYLVGSAALYAVGMSQLAFYVGPKAAVTMGLLPFIPGDILKGLAVATLVAKR